jgi:hypothetical protein
VSAETNTASDYATSHRAALRHLVQRVPGLRATAAGGPSLERMGGAPEEPHLIDAVSIEGATLRAHPVVGAPVAAFSAFLDGVQESRVLAWQGAAPVVFGTVAAAVRRRVERRLSTWERPVVERRIYAPLAYLPAAALRAAFTEGELVDTARPDAGGSPPPPHPTLLLERAKTAVSRDRESAERRLAEHWCAQGGGPLCIDGGISGSDVLARDEQAVGVVKSHRTLYASGAALDTVLGLARGERSSVFRLAPRERSAVHSWYLRLRDPAGQHALFGLVRVEVAATAEDARAAAARADDVSRWVLAEASPLARPDARWDVMSYPIRDCEEFLRAIA